MTNQNDVSIVNRTRNQYAQMTSALVASSRRCHAVGAATCAVMLGLTAWVWATPERFVTGADHDRGAVIDSVQLLDHADEWRTEYVSLHQKAGLIQRRSRQIASWLPSSVQWPLLDEQYRVLANNVNVEVVSLRQQDNHIGSRIGVVMAECQVKGSYSSICDFIRRLSALEANRADQTEQHYAAWCHRVRIQRLPGFVQNEVHCAATIMLRVPFAAEGSAAAEIVKPGASDA